MPGRLDAGVRLTLTFEHPFTMLHRVPPHELPHHSRDIPARKRLEKAMLRAACGFLLWTLFAAPAVAGTRDAQWKRVRDDLDSALPKSAITVLDSILTGAKKERSHAEAVKALAMRVALEGNIEGRREEKIERLQAALPQQPAAMQPPLQTILALWYWQYFQENRWRFVQRTQAAGTAGADMATWDLARILAEIDARFRRALANEKVLQAIPVTAYDALLVPGSMPDSYRPTLFDFLAHEALQFYSAGEQAGASAEDAFELDAESPILSSTDEFLDWHPQATDDASPTLAAVRLYQKLLVFHRRDADKTAFADLDLDRLVFAHNKVVGDEASARYKAALQHFVGLWAAHEVSSRALAEWAQVSYGEGEFLEAHTLATRGLRAFPASVGGASCSNLVMQIEAKSASIRTERVWNEPLPEISVTYRNITRIFFRVIPYDFAACIARSGWDACPLDVTERQRLLALQPLSAWKADLPATLDYQERTESLPAPRGLRPGFYFVLCSHDSTFADKEHDVGIAPIWVSDLALVTRVRPRTHTVEGFVLRARTGEPVRRATIESWALGNGRRKRPHARVVTDGNGYFSIAAPQRSTLMLVARSGEQRLSTADNLQAQDWIPEGARNRTILFTDRSLYRPGQMVHYKGIRIRFDRDKNDYRVLPGETVTVVFSDANSKEIEQATHTCNDYGSFDGAFTVPRDRLSGTMTLHAPEGSVWFNVEEYKRPKFQVDLGAPTVAAKLDAEVVVPGRAVAYTGAAIGGARVRWRVVRQARFPPWCWWWSPIQAQNQAIAHGTMVTAADGSFAIRFVARPNRAVPEQDEPTFEYRVHVDVTDTSGETRSDERSVRAGYTALRASLTAAAWQTPDAAVEITALTRSLDDVPQAASGTLRIHDLVQPEHVARAGMFERWEERRPRLAVREPAVAANDPNTWELGPIRAKMPFQTDDTGKSKIAIPLEVGIYRAILETQDRFGKKVGARLLVQVVDPKARHFPIRVANHFAAPKWQAEPGEPFVALWGTGYDSGRACVEIEHRGRLLRRTWTRGGRTQELVRQQVGEEFRGGFTVRVTFVRENRVYVNERVVDVPWSNKLLSVKWEHFRSRLEPGAKETWTATISGPGAHGAAAEMVTGLYDASLDQFAPHDWPHGFDVFRHEFRQQRGTSFANVANDVGISIPWPRPDFRAVDRTYRTFAPEVETLPGGAYHVRGGRRMPLAAGAMGIPPSVAAPVETPPAALPVEEVREAVALQSGVIVTNSADAAAASTVAPRADLDRVSARRRLQETAFFFPHLLSDSTGVVRIEFTMPEALTEWKLLGFAHDRELRCGYITDRVVTTKDLMVEPNPPRFLREGDTIELTVKVTNLSGERQTGSVKLTLADARTLASRDAALGNKRQELDFDVAAGESRQLSWPLTVPDGCEVLTYKAVGASAKASDGEEGYLPVLGRRVLVTESLPLPLRGKGTRQFQFPKLLASDKSRTLRHQSLTVQMVSQPAWYAVMALPYLMESPYECSEQVFSRLYANSLARHIADSDPKVRRIFDLWKNTAALDSPLEKNADLKGLLLEATPWVVQARSESQARRNVGTLFDANRLDAEAAGALRRLADMQMSDGLWPWFPGGTGDPYISLTIATGFGRLRHLGVEVDVAPALRALDGLDRWLEDRYRDVLRHGRSDENNLSPTIALYLYGRSFFLNDRPVAPEHLEALDYWRRQSRQFWVPLRCRQSQAHIALGLQRFGDRETPGAILKSLAERSVSDPELGMFWRDSAASWWWYHAPIETQALMVEAFDEVAHDAAAVEACKVWLLKQKQVQDWKTTTATADAIYALLLRGTGMLASDVLVEVALAGETLRPQAVEAGTGFYEERFVRDAVRPRMGDITVRKADDGVSWGGIHWQYLEDLSKVSPYAGTPLQLRKALFVRVTTQKGPVLRPVSGPLALGDELVVRLELRSDRDLAYVHLHDQRASGTEPVDVLSQYRFQDGLAYYQSTRDTGTHFFFDRVPTGVHVIEYTLRVQHRGEYQAGVASIQCMYAPEFNSHSESLTLKAH